MCSTPSGATCSRSHGDTISKLSPLSLFPKTGKDTSAVPVLSRGKRTPGFYLRLSAIWLSLGNYLWILLLILAVAWFVRVRNPHFASAYLDESIYVLYGRMFLTRHFEAPLGQPLDFSFGWYLWPILAATADRLRGLVGVRELAAFLGTLTVLSLYGLARRLFSPAVGLASAAIFALLGPAVLASRIATRDSGTICFFAIGLWLFVRAWQENDGTWLASAFFFFAAFLCKYVVALFFPFLVIVSFRKKVRPLLFFALPLTLACAAYAYHYAPNLRALISYSGAYTSLKAPASEARKIYFTGRIDFWILLLLSLFAWRRDPAVSYWTRALLLWGALVMPIFQLISRADYDYWKHVNYSLLFLVPLAMYGLLRLLSGWTKTLSPILGAAVVTLLAAGLGGAGNAWHIDRFVFWPNVEPITAYFENRLAPEDRILVDDSVLRYYFHPTLPQWQIVDPFYFRYDNQKGGPAYAEAVRRGLFDYIALDGGIGEDARRMRAAIQPELGGRYALRLSMPDPTLNQPIEIYERENPPPQAPLLFGPQIKILAPANEALVKTENKTMILRGTTVGAGPGWYVETEVFTNRWYPHGVKVFPRLADGSFSQTIYLAGEGEQQCYHLVRARLHDKRGRPVAVAVEFGIARANPDGSPPACRSSEQPRQ